MWKITVAVSRCRKFLPMAAMNVAPVLIATDRGERTIWRSRAPRFNRLQEIVMAKVIEFYIPKNFRKPLRTVAEPQLGRIVEFCPQTKRSA